MKWLVALVLAVAAPLAFAADAVAPEAMPPESVVLDSTYFGSASASLTFEGFQLLHAIAAAMLANPAMRLEVEGHSDMSGPAPMNLQLSNQRAVVVREFLVSFGVAPERLVARGYGETRPVNDNKTLEKRSWNRRVQFRRLDTP